ncbi:MAG TPA: Uma2 family endonuclease [Gemmataceae bacterium]|nr:Uma2 family endonuclease [Gemmataceae bacterium]
MGIKTRAGCFTYDDFCALIREDQKADLIDGVIYMASPENTDANDLFVWLISLIHGYVESKNLGQVFGSRVACRLNNRNGPEPDILFVAREHADRIHRGGVEGAPDLAIEIVSPESVERDYDKKRQQYQQAGIPEYWILDEEEKTILLLRLNARGRYREVRPRRGIFPSQVLLGFYLDPNWLWGRPRPLALQILQQLLAGPSGE